MPDLNELLKWSIANSTASNAAAESNSENAEEQQLSLRWNPGTAHAGTSALHPNDHQENAEMSLASNPGFATPRDGTSSPLPADAEIPGAKREDLTTEMLDLIMGKSDSMVMKEKIAFATDESQSLEQRVEALDDFEMLVELIDNANNMPILKLWDPLLGLLSSPHPEIVAHACWIIGTAVQNNIQAQAALYIHEVFPRILDIIYPSSSSPHPSSVRAKATYALSSALKHWPLASIALSSSSSDGYSVLKRGVADSDVVVRRKMAFLVGTLTMQSGEKFEGELPNDVRNVIEEKSKAAEAAGLTGSLAEGLAKSGVFAALLDGLKENGEDVEFEENSVRALVQAAQKGALTDGEKTDLKDLWAKWGSEGQEARGLSGEDGKDVSAVLQ